MMGVRNMKNDIEIPSDKNAIPSRKTKLKNIIKKLVLVIIILFVILVAIGATYNLIRQDDETTTPSTQDSEETDKAYTYNKPDSLYCTPSFEREDWETTDVGDVNHIVYGVGMFDENGSFCWHDGTLTLELFNETDDIVFSSSQSIAEENIEYPKISGITQVYYIYDYEIEGDILDVTTYNATYTTANGSVIYSEGEVVGPY
jgi:hypothetical protein